MPGRSDRRLRIVALFVVLVVLAGAATVRLAYWQVARAPELQRRALATAEEPIELPAVRGDIVDRHGTVLAHTGFLDALAAYPDQVDDAEGPTVAAELAAILGRDRAGAEAIEAQLALDAHYVVIDREISAAQSEQVRQGLSAGRLVGLALEPHPVRMYPNPGGAPGTTLASQALGFVTNDGQGHYGIEQAYDDVLAGRPRQLASVADLSLGAGHAFDPGVDGQKLHLTIDAGLQLQLEKELYAAWVADRAKRVSGLIVDPRSGEILAWASVPGYDANDFASVAAQRPTLLIDPIASGVYEPGSVMKAFTAAAALSSGRFKPGTAVSDGRGLRFPGAVVRNADLRSMGRLRFEDVIAYSRNVGTARVAMNLDRTRKRSAIRLWRTWQALGLGRPTGVDIAGEARGIVADPRRSPWADLDLANRSFGQGVAVTQVQLVAGFAAMVNGGFRVKPQFVRPATGSEPVRERVLPARVAKQMWALLKHVTASVPWYAKGSLIRGFEVGGKTGTAQIWRADRRMYAPRTFNFTFVGYVGTERPEAIISVRIHEARPRVDGPGDLHLNITSYELFRRVARDVISSLGLPRLDDPDAGLPERGSAAEQVLTPQRYRESLRKAHRAERREPRTERRQREQNQADSR